MRDMLEGRTLVRAVRQEYVHREVMVVPKTERFEMRLDEEILGRVERWREVEAGGISRSEAMRQLVEIGLATGSKESVRFSDGEKIIILMLRDLYAHLKVKDPEIDPTFLGEVIWGGHYWAPKWELTGVFHDYADDPRVLKETVDILEMWESMERAYSKLGKKDKELVEKEAEPLGKSVRFPGFDGNNESAHLGIAGFLVKKMGRFSTFKGRDLNSHLPLLPGYRQMLPVFEGIRERWPGGELGATQIVALLKAIRR